MGSSGLSKSISFQLLEYLHNLRLPYVIANPSIAALQSLIEGNYKILQFKHKVDVHENAKSWAKLLHKCSDLKETLSANKEATIYIEGLINGIDLNMAVKREIL